MKKLILIILMSVAAWAQAGIYTGFGTSYSSEHFTAISTGFEEKTMSAAMQSVKVKAGYGVRGGYAIEVALGYGEYDKNIFSDNDGEFISLDLDIIKSFDFDLGFQPFIKLGFGAGYMTVDRVLESSLANGSFQVGGGVYIPLGSSFEIEMNVIYRGRNWENVDLIGDPAEVSTSVVEPYIGLNYRF